MSQPDLVDIEFDSKPLDGLRGLAALHLVLFHAVREASLPYKISIYGQVR